MKLAITLSALLLTGNATAQVTSTDTWQSFGLDRQNGIFTLELDMTPSSDAIDAVTGIARKAIDGEADTAIAIRFAPDGALEAIDAGSYGVTNVIPYAGGTTYHLRLIARLASRDFSAYVTPNGGTEQTLARNFSFRATESALDNWGVRATAGSHEVTGVTITSSGLQRQYSLKRATTPPTIDGDPLEMEAAPVIVLTSPTTGAAATYRLLWDDRALYIGMSVFDEHLNAPTTTGELWRDDGLEIMFDPNHSHGGSQQADDTKLLVNIANRRAATSALVATDDIAFTSAVVLDGTLDDDSDTDVGYRLEVEILWSDWGVAPPTPGAVWGLEVQLNDRNGASRAAVPWSNVNGGQPNDPDAFGDMHVANDAIATINGAGDHLQVTAESAGCADGEYYDYLAEACRMPAAATGCTASAGHAAFLLVALLTLLRRRR